MTTCYISFCCYLDQDFALRTMWSTYIYSLRATYPLPWQPLDLKGPYDFKVISKDEWVLCSIISSV